MMKKIAVLLASSFAAISAFAAPLEVVSYSNGTYDFRVNETGYLKLEFACNYAPNPYGFAWHNLPDIGYYSTLRPDSKTEAISNAPFILEFQAGTTLGIWGRGIRYDWDGRYQFFTLTNDASVKLFSGYSNTLFMYDDLTITDTQITGDATFTFSYVEYGSSWGNTIIGYQDVNTTFTLTWGADPTFPAGNTNGQPLPGVAVALVLGAGAYVARRRRNRQA